MRLDAKVDEIKEELYDIAIKLHENPEISDEEVFACGLLSNYLKAKGFEVTVNVAGHHTGFIATYDTNIEGPHVVITAEYDALKGLGHACGHNLIAASSVGSAVVIKDAIEIGKISVFGTPAEEGGSNGSSKASFVRAGYFDDVDFSCSVHPGSTTHPSGNFIACRTLTVEFFGKPSHASASPEYGCNALDAMINFYNQINALRQQTVDSARIHGIITDGGDAPNIIPSYTQAVFYVRASTKAQAQNLVDKFLVIADASAMGAFCEVKVTEDNNPVDDIVHNDVFDNVFTAAFTRLGETVCERPAASGSTDVGNVSYVVPTVHPTFKVCDVNVQGHTEAFASACRSDFGLSATIVATKAIVESVVRVYEDSQLLETIKVEFEKQLALK